MKYELEHEAKTFGDWAYVAVAKHYNKFLSHELAVLEDKDPEELHQMRVGMRRLRSAINGFSIALSLPQNAQPKKVGKIAKILGNLRDLDVLTDSLENQYYPHLPKKDQKQLKQALSILEKQRKKVFKEVKSTLNSQNYSDLKQAFDHWLNHPHYHDIAQVSMEFILADLLLPEVSQLMLYPGWLVGFKVESQGSNFSAQLSQKEVESLLDKNELVLHDLRKVAKRTRYNMELFSQFYSENYETYLKDIKNIQTILGDIQDSFVLCEFLNNIFDKNILNKMPAFSNILQENRYHKWQEWEGLQQKFFNSEIRKNFHLTILDPSIIQSSPQESDKGIEEIVSTNVSD
ncbi:CHAD domain-containing protein [Crocosphaera sp. Alani8]|uniref:CHAD domain-containing protein n=1 Tax=Crocosphaera sp. Alani8 TaxID=3038952 RepID=UPI00313F2D11